MATKELFFNGVSEYELEALRVPNQERNACQKWAIILRKCYQNHKSISLFRWKLANPCQNELRKVNLCKQKFIRPALKIYDVMQMKARDANYFKKEGVSPTLDEEVLDYGILHF